MVQLDPEEIFGSAIVEAAQRALAIFACLYLGSFLALLGALGFETAATLISSRFTALPDYQLDGSLVLLPFMSFASAFVFLTIPNILCTAVYFFRSEEPTRQRFILFTTIQQISIAGAFAEYSLSYSPSILDVVIVVVGGLIFQATAWGLFYFALTFIKNKQRCSHEEHLMTVAAENAVWRQKLEDAEIVPPPPSGPEAPKARPLR